MSTLTKGNHIHLVVRAVSRNGFKKFLMAISGRIAELVTKASRKNPLAQPFWDFIPWTRILEWGRAFEIAKHYVVKNQLEAAGVIAYQARKNSRQRRPTSITPPKCNQVDATQKVREPKTCVSGCHMHLTVG